MKYELVLGLEIHMHLKLNTKMFCGCSADFYGNEPNTHTCPVCLGLPGALPVPNGKAIKYTQLLGIALNSKLNKVSKFDRKNYFYPDLPKGYQISQFDLPFCYDGFLEVNDKKILITRVHLEEDTAKSFHDKENSYIDFNKSGAALVEIVTEPDFRSASDAVAFSKEIQRIARALGISDCDMEKGQMRLEANISLRPEGQKDYPNYKVEVKNINSFRFLEKAVLYEIKRQTELLNSGVTPKQENRGWDDIKQVTLSQRDKEDAHDYRYFPEPDIPPYEFSSAYLEELTSSIPELPAKKAKRYVSSYGINKEAADFITDTLELCNLFEETIKNVDPKLVANYIMNKPETRTMSASDLSALIKDQHTKNYESDDLQKQYIEEVLKEYAVEYTDYKNGKDPLLQFLVGQVMKKSKGKADPAFVKNVIEQSK